MWSMKAVVTLILALGISLTASAMGHPHNLFSAHRKAMQYKPTECRPSASVNKQVLTQVRTTAPTTISWGWAILRKKFL